ncbi:hypothetical protein OCK74_00470 [Chitinophagaceae bacterium LB-8]|uniref:Uncharacterized protein n=1 Tax=Paraflavisolibacter caeni TaxID=2982496 RepID=A0A9X2XSR0_9BACT|nr:hypothetical protein [Paraflavisolibacter caeni]MCU7547561.1 hypothetical protein [Paraflavisolibacter caeni]
MITKPMYAILFLCCFYISAQSHFFVYHAYTRAANGASLLNIKPLYIDEEGWPTLDPSKKLFKREEFHSIPKP